MSVKGSKVGRAIGGAGYVELTGYAGSFDAPLYICETGTVIGADLIQPSETIKLILPFFGQ